ncbi:MAG: precorrin-6Y C5,15-methyltransferase (decarboxylating) subunit CbiT, partial [Pseudomonadota bacterium]
IIVLLRDGQAVGTLASTLIGAGFGDSRMTVCQALGGSREKISEVSPAEASERVFQHPVCAALEIKGAGEALPLASGLPDALFAHDGQITKRPVRAMTLSALAPKHGEHLWDIGGGSGSISIEWLLADPSLRATTIEVDAPRAARIRENAMALGVDRLQVITGRAPAVLEGLGLPDVVFVGGGLSADLLERLISLGSGVRLVANAVTLEAETLLTDARKRLGGSLMRMDFSSAEPLGTKTGWRASFPVVQWSVTL